MTRRYCPCYRYCLQSHPSFSLYLAIYTYLQHTPAVEQLIRFNFRSDWCFRSSTSLYLRIFVRSYWSLRTSVDTPFAPLDDVFCTSMDDVRRIFRANDDLLDLSCYRAPLVPMDLHLFFVLSHLLWTGFAPILDSNFFLRYYILFAKYS